MAGLYVVATPIGNMGDFSPRAVETLKRCRLILAEDTRRSGRLLAAFDIDTPMMSYHQFNERSRMEQIIEALLSQPGDVALISDAGTPGISDPGVMLVREAHARGIPVYGVSGPSALITALSVSGLPTETFSFFGFPPRRKEALRNLFRSLPHSHVQTYVFFESPRRVTNFLTELAAVHPAAWVSVSTELTKIHEKTWVHRVDVVLEHIQSDPYAQKGEYTVVVHLPEAASTASDRGKDGEDSPLSVEAQIVDFMVKNRSSLREAVDAVAQRGQVTKNAAYAAGIAVQRLFRRA